MATPGSHHAVLLYYPWPCFTRPTCWIFCWRWCAECVLRAPPHRPCAWAGGCNQFYLLMRCEMLQRDVRWRGFLFGGNISKVLSSTRFTTMCLATQTYHSNVFKPANTASHTHSLPPPGLSLLPPPCSRAHTSTPPPTYSHPLGPLEPHPGWLRAATHSQPHPAPAPSLTTTTNSRYSTPAPAPSPPLSRPGLQAPSHVSHPSASRALLVGSHCAESPPTPSPAGRACLFNRPLHLHPKLESWFPSPHRT